MIGHVQTEVIASIPGYRYVCDTCGHRSSLTTEDRAELAQRIHDHLHRAGRIPYTPQI